MHSIWLPSPLFMQMWARYHRFYKAETNNHAPPLPPSQYLTVSDLYNCYAAVWHCGDSTARWRLLIGCKRHSSIKHLCLWIPTLWLLKGFGGARLAVQALDIWCQSISEKIGHNFMQHLSSDAVNLNVQVKTAVCAVCGSRKWKSLLQ